MIQNLELKLWTGTPIDFYGICNIYPLTVKDYIHYNDVPEDATDELNYIGLLAPFIMNNLFLKDNGIEFDDDIWDYYFLDAKMLTDLVYALAVFTHEINIRIDLDHKTLVFPGTEQTDAKSSGDGVAQGKAFGKEHFEEFASIILKAHNMKKYQHPTKVAPKIKNKDYADRLKKYTQNRKKNKSIKDDIDLAAVIKCIQLFSPSYIPAAEILTWNYWKVLHWYEDVICKSDYDHLNACFAHWGGKDLRKGLDKLKKELRTTI